MKFNLNSKRFEHIKNVESVFETLIHLGGKATSSEIVRQMAKLVGQPEDVVHSEVKHVLRVAVVNGYLVRCGKNYLLSRSCRTFCTDSSSTEKKEGEASSFTTFGFPIWWNRFWNRFVASKEKKESLAAQSTNENSLHCNEPHSTCSTELNDPESGLEQETEEASTQADISSKNIFPATDSPVVLNISEENVSTNGPTTSPHEMDAIEHMSSSLMSNIDESNETEVFESMLTDSQPIAKFKELRTNYLCHSIERVDDSNSFVVDDELDQDYWMD